MASTHQEVSIEKEEAHRGSHDHEEESDSSVDSTDLPTLEQIDKEMKGPVSKKNIVIPDDKKSEKGDQDHGDDDEDKDDEETGGYVDILNNKDLRKKTVKPGNGQRPTRGSKVAIRLVSRVYKPQEGQEEAEDAAEVGSGDLISGESFDRFIVDIGDNDLYQGLDLILPLMDEKETARAIIKPRFAYGSLGNQSAGVPESATLDLEIELLEILDRADDLAGYGGESEESGIADKETLDERHRAGTYKKDRGNFWFQRNEFSTAIQCYRGAIKHLDLSEKELKQLDNIKKEKKEEQDELARSLDDLIEKRALTFNNLAAAQIKLKAFDMAAQSVDQSLLLRPDNPKALFRRAKIYLERGEVEKAIGDLKQALKLNPSSEAISIELEKMNRILAQQLQKQREMYRRMMKSDQPNNERKIDNGSAPNTSRASIQSTTDKLKHWAGRFGLPAVGVAIGALTLQAVYSSFMK